MLKTTSLMEMNLEQGPVIVFLSLVVISICWLWLTQFIQLMLMSEHDFPGRLDKQIWGAAFVLLFFLAPLAFFFWKSAYVEQQAVADDEQVATNEHDERQEQPKKTAVSTS